MIRMSSLKTKVLCESHAQEQQNCLFTLDPLHTDGMWCSLISMWIFLVCLDSTWAMTIDRGFDHYRRIRLSRSSLLIVDDGDNQVNNMTSQSLSPIATPVSDNCPTQVINIDTDTSSIPYDITDHDIGSKIIDMTQFLSSWRRDTSSTDVESPESSTSLHTIELTFRIPYTISTESILNKTIFISDAKQNHLLGILTQICVNGSLFTIKYSTNQSLPQTVCLYLLLNLSSSTISSREIFSCQMVYPTGNNSHSSESINHESSSTSETSGPSPFFILSQSLIILFMMFVIYVVHTARQKNLFNRLHRNLLHSRPFVAIFGTKAADSLSARASRAGGNGSIINSAATLQTGLQQFALRYRQAAAAASMPVPIEEQVLAAADLTSTLNDRRASRPFLRHDLIDVKEFTKRISIPNTTSEESNHIELTPPWKPSTNDDNNDDIETI